MEIIYWIFLRVNLTGDKIGYVEFIELLAKDNGDSYRIQQHIINSNRILDKKQLVKTNVKSDRILVNAYCLPENLEDCKNDIFAQLAKEAYKKDFNINLILWNGAIITTMNKYFTEQDNPIEENGN